jgi:hypothetical protein
MSKTANSSKVANNVKSFPELGPGYREIGIAAVAAALRCQQLPAPDDERAGANAHDPSLTDRLP